MVAEAETPRTTVATALVYSSNVTDATEPERDECASPEQAQKNAGQVQTILVGKRTLEETTLTGQGADEKKQRSPPLREGEERGPSWFLIGVMPMGARRER